MIEHGIDKLEAVPLTQDATHPNPADDGDGAEGALVATVGMPEHGDVLVFDATAPNKWVRVPKPPDTSVVSVLTWQVGESAPSWAVISEGTLASGYGNNYGNDYGGPP